MSAGKWMDSPKGIGQLAHSGVGVGNAPKQGVGSRRRRLPKPPTPPTPTVEHRHRRRSTVTQGFYQKKAASLHYDFALDSFVFSLVLSEKKLRTQFGLNRFSVMLKTLDFSFTLFW